MICDACKLEGARTVALVRAKLARSVHQASALPHFKITRCRACLDDLEAQLPAKGRGRAHVLELDDPELAVHPLRTHDRAFPPLPVTQGATP